MKEWVLNINNALNVMSAIQNTRRRGRRGKHRHHKTKKKETDIVGLSQKNEVGPNALINKDIAKCYICKLAFFQFWMLEVFLVRKGIGYNPVRMIWDFVGLDKTRWSRGIFDPNCRMSQYAGVFGFVMFPPMYNPKFRLNPTDPRSTPICRELSYVGIKKKNNKKEKIFVCNHSKCREKYRRVADVASPLLRYSVKEIQEANGVNLSMWLHTMNDSDNDSYSE